MRTSRKTRLHDAKFWKTLGIFFKATRLLDLGSVTDLEKKFKKIKNALAFVKKCNNRFSNLTQTSPLS